MISITIPYRPVTKKNHPVMVRPGLILPSQAYRDFHKFAIGTRTRPGYLLLKYGNVCFEEPVEMTVDYYLANRRIPDVSNLISATCDVLEAANIVTNDNLIWCINAAISGIDKHNPRTELTLEIKKPEWWR